jgi:hypothetical protein
MAVVEWGSVPPHLLGGEFDAVLTPRGGLPLLLLLLFTVLSLLYSRREPFLLRRRGPGGGRGGEHHPLCEDFPSFSLSGFAGVGV